MTTPMLANNFEKAYREDEVERVKRGMIKLISREDQIKKMVEADEAKIPEPKRELREDRRKHRSQFTEIAKRALNYDIIKYIAP